MPSYILTPYLAYFPNKCTQETLNYYQYDLNLFVREFRYLFIDLLFIYSVLQIYFTHLIKIKL